MHPVIFRQLEPDFAVPQQAHEFEKFHLLRRGVVPHVAPRVAPRVVPHVAPRVRLRRANAPLGHPPSGRDARHVRDVAALIHLADARARPCRRGESARNRASHRPRRRRIAESALPCRAGQSATPAAFPPARAAARFVEKRVGCNGRRALAPAARSQQRPLSRRTRPFQCAAQCARLPAAVNATLVRPAPARNARDVRDVGDVRDIAALIYLGDARGRIVPGQRALSTDPAAAATRARPSPRDESARDLSRYRARRAGHPTQVPARQVKRALPVHPCDAPHSPSHFSPAALPTAALRAEAAVGHHAHEVAWSGTRPNPISDFPAMPAPAHLQDPLSPHPARPQPPTPT